MFSDWTTNITMTLYNFIHNNIQLKAPKWIQQKKINKKTKGERMHLWDSNNNRTIGSIGRLKKILLQNLNKKLGMQLIGKMKRLGVLEVRGRERDRWKCEIINLGDKEVREFKRWEEERGRWRGEVEEQPWERIYFLFF